MEWNASQPSNKKTIAQVFVKRCNIFFCCIVINSKNKKEGMLCNCPWSFHHGWPPLPHHTGGTTFEISSHTCAATATAVICHKELWMVQNVQHSSTLYVIFFYYCSLFFNQATIRMWVRYTMEWMAEILQWKVAILFHLIHTNLF